ncbi:MAG: hypothetical protein IT373_08855 [Polyangiaceae bacterium]|nr:hypothetical protein [Polyangiaceae bacterium]
MLLAAGLGLVGASATSCGKSGAELLCDEVCKCELCNDRKEDECVIEAGLAEDIASAYDCDDRRETYDDCRLHAGDCVDSRWHPGDCARELDDLCDCIHAAADVDDSVIRDHFPCN